MTIEEAREYLAQELLRKERQKASRGKQRAEKIAADPKAFFTRPKDFAEEEARQAVLRAQGKEPSVDLSKVPRLNVNG